MRLVTSGACRCAHCAAPHRVDQFIRRGTHVLRRTCGTRIADGGEGVAAVRRRVSSVRSTRLNASGGEGPACAPTCARARRRPLAWPATRRSAIASLASACDPFRGCPRARAPGILPTLRDTTSCSSNRSGSKSTSSGPRSGRGASSSATSTATRASRPPPTTRAL